MNLLFVSADLSPLSGESQLGGFVAQLGGALSSLGHDITVCSPLHDQRLVDRFSLARRLSPLKLDLPNGSRECFVYDGKLPSGVSVKVFEHPELSPGEGGVTPLSGALLSKAALNVMSNGITHVVHAFGHPTALTPFFAQQAAPFSAVPRVYTLESLQDPGRCDKSWVERLGLSWDDFTPERLEFYGDLSLLKGALISSDRIIFPGYSAMLEPFSRDESGLDGVLRERRDKLASLLPGLDYSRWNPATDPEVPVHYDAEQPDGKRSCKAHLQYLLELPICSSTPVIALSPALDELASPLAATLERLLRTEVQLVAPRDQTTELSGVLEAMRTKYPRKIAWRPFTEPEWHQVLAGVDVVVVNSPHDFDAELVLAALRYGALPVSPSRGIARDLIVDLSNTQESGNGFLVDAEDSNDLFAVLRRAIATFCEGSRVGETRHRCMTVHCSWEDRARHLEGLYNELLPVDPDEEITEEGAE